MLKKPHQDFEIKNFNCDCAKEFTFRKSAPPPPKGYKTIITEKSNPPECSILFNACYSEQYAVCTVQVDVPYHYRF